MINSISPENMSPRPRRHHVLQRRNHGNRLRIKPPGPKVNKINKENKRGKTRRETAIDSCRGNFFATKRLA